MENLFFAGHFLKELDKIVLVIITNSILFKILFYYSA